MPNQARVNSLQPASERADQRWRPTTEPSSKDRRISSESEKRTEGHEALAFYNAAGTIVVACAWLAIYAIATVPPLVAWSLSVLRQVR